ncbi:hypothetical protein [Pseudomonas sp. DSP3-2-2]|uniref:hypothetical protein n=1 Tax=unclassified Pseudomonas TaxID=196821 RepID=UPI003CF252CC
MPEIKERPILFSAPMVRAILEDRKTVTRRVVEDQPFDLSWSRRDHQFEYTSGRAENGDEIDGFYAHTTRSGGEWNAKCHYGQPGNRLWVRETWYCDHFEVMRGPYLKPDDLDVAEARGDGTLVYAADGLTPYEADQPAWKPSIHMPRWACRILLEITSVRVERLQEITYEDAVAEGVYRDSSRVWTGSDEGGPCHKYPEPAFRDLWISTGGDWNTNPWVWVVEFKRVTP